MTLTNDQDLIRSTVGILCRSRKEGRMFHLFSVSPEGCICLKFLWWESGQFQTEQLKYRMTVHLFGDDSSKGCANIGLNYRAQKHKADHPSQPAFLQKNYYVDEGLTSVLTIMEDKELIFRAQQLCNSASLCL